MNVDYTVSSGNVFEDLGIPDAEEAMVKADLAMEIAATIKKRHLTQAQAAKIMEIDQSRVSRIVRGHLDRYSIDILLRFLTLLDRDVTIVVGAEQSDKRGSLRVRAS
jgi:predicted XRE-type DNA-binding protein